MKTTSFVFGFLAALMAITAQAGIGTQDSAPQSREPLSEPVVGKQPQVRKSRLATPEEDREANMLKRQSRRYAKAKVTPVSAIDRDAHRDNCLRFTGSRLLRDDRTNQRCAIGSGRVYVREQ